MNRKVLWHVVGPPRVGRGYPPLQNAGQDRRNGHNQPLGTGHDWHSIFNPSEVPERKLFGLFRPLKDDPDSHNRLYEKRSNFFTALRDCRCPECDQYRSESGPHMLHPPRRIFSVHNVMVESIGYVWRQNRYRFGPRLGSLGSADRPSVAPAPSWAHKWAVAQLTQVTAQFSLNAFTADAPGPGGGLRRRWLRACQHTTTLQTHLFRSSADRLEATDSRGLGRSQARQQQDKSTAHNRNTNNRQICGPHRQTDCAAHHSTELTADLSHKYWPWRGKRVHWPEQHH
ncbi:hypothetical protein J6590_027675 [Homalodisca vitripennis]|nr:hypothetical protein J6590_027675 [Homalodisca vitripennis]